MMSCEWKGILFNESCHETTLVTLKSLQIVTEPANHKLSRVVKNIGYTVYQIIPED